jgi:hypothetical protein
MPWMPEVFTAPIAEARRAQDAQAEGTNDAVPYFEGILSDEPDALVGSFAARQPVLDDRRVGRVEGARELYAFVIGTGRSGCASATRWWRTSPSPVPSPERSRRSC